ncbi:glycosyltransferase [Romboutsia sedimentorum]|uniref:glycosyltransferase n=1 Tax=Romboutsia sedimentorum TaxID=1368474 RepID=UPI0024DE71DE|nr:glycosyltransferase [Romboutsia sedimentorum]MDK2585826.1 glycosyltransferase [Romboutsia sedimentorum]
MKKVKILHMPVTNSGSGVSKYILENLKFINTDEFQFDFVTFSEKIDFEDDVKKYGGQIHYFKYRAEENKEKFIEAMNKIFDLGYDVVHLHTSYWKSFLVEEIAIKRKIPKIIVHSHSTMVDLEDSKKRNEAICIHENQKKLFNKDLATHFFACSQEASDWLFGEQIHRKSIRIMNNAIDTEQFSYDRGIRAKYRKDLNLEGCFVLGHVGRFTHSKNHEIIIDIFKSVCENMPNARLILVGDGPLKESIYNKANKNNILDKILFLGKRSDVANIMQAMDVFLLPSRFEGLGLVLIEAQSTGLKCLASENVPKEAKLTSLMEYIPYNVDDWCEKIISYSSGYKRTDKSKEIARRGYCIKEQIKLIEKIYSNSANL